MHAGINCLYFNFVSSLLDTCNLTEELPANSSVLKTNDTVVCRVLTPTRVHYGNGHIELIKLETMGLRRFSDSRRNIVRHRTTVV